jgi:hypothetical protein
MIPISLPVKVCHFPSTRSAAQKRSASGSFANTSGISSSSANAIAMSYYQPYLMVNTRAPIVRLPLLRGLPFSSGLGNWTVGKSGSGKA